MIRRADPPPDMRQHVRRALQRLVILILGTTELLLSFAVFIVSGVLFTALARWGEAHGAGRIDGIVVVLLQAASSCAFFVHGMVLVVSGVADILRGARNEILGRKP